VNEPETDNFWLTDLEIAIIYSFTVRIKIKN